MSLIVLLLRFDEYQQRVNFHRNLIINGGMIVKQRADDMICTSTYSLDRFRAAVGSSFNWSSATVTQSTTSPDEF